MLLSIDRETEGGRIPNLIIHFQPPLWLNWLYYTFFTLMGWPRLLFWLPSPCYALDLLLLSSHRFQVAFLHDSERCCGIHAGEHIFSFGVTLVTLNTLMVVVKWLWICSLIVRSNVACMRRSYGLSAVSISWEGELSILGPEASQWIRILSLRPFAGCIL